MITDDGIGGADPARGSGLRGLADRIEALDGGLRVESPPQAAARASRRRSPAADARSGPATAPGYPWCGSVAQGTEQKPSKLPVGGSNPSGPIAGTA